MNAEKVAKEVLLYVMPNSRLPDLERLYIHVVGRVFATLSTVLMLLWLLIQMIQMIQMIQILEMIQMIHIIQMIQMIQAGMGWNRLE